jgi:single-strand DNA-binding protein
MLNRIVLMGRLTRAPELKYTPSNVAVCTITLACERDYAPQGQQREADFIDVVCWRHTAEFVSRYFRKGQLVAAEGRLQSRKWADKAGQNRVSFEVVADQCYFAERTQQPAATQPSGFDQITAEAKRAGVPAASWPEYNEPDGDFAPIDDDDVPF